jgi:hypothetical protein
MITARALQVLLKGKNDNEMVFVRIKDPTGYIYSGRVLPDEDDLEGTRIPTISVEATNGELVWNVKTERIIGVDVVPFRRFTGYGVKEFVDDFGPGVS